MTTKLIRDLLLVLLVFFGVWLGFTLLKPAPKIPTLRLSVEDEEKLGEALTSAMFTDYDLNKAPSLDTALTTITFRLTEAIDSPIYDFKFHVIRNNEINAFATLGGHIYVFTGLLEVLETPEQLAAVLAHEIGHVEERHVVDKLSREFGMSVLFSLVSMGDPSLLAEIMQFAISGAFSRSQEKEADEFGLELLESANIDPISLAEAFVILKKEGGESFVPAFLQSHPNIDSRIKASKNYQTDTSFSEVLFDLQWARMQEEVKENR